MTILDTAITFAINAHSGMIRKGSPTPYIIHPLETVIIAATMTDDPEVLAAAALHDTLEDTGTTREELEHLFGCRVAELVAGESENKMRERPAADTWKDRKQATLRTMSHQSREEKIICLSDKLSNLRSLRRDLDRLGDDLWLRFNQKNPAEHAWYFGAMQEALKELSDTEAYREYDELMATVFRPYRK